MAEKKEAITFDPKELAEILVNREKIHDGHWGLTVDFGLGAGAVPFPPGSSTHAPAAIVAIMKIGIQRFDESAPFTVDAAKVNPKQK